MTESDQKTVTRWHPVHALDQMTTEPDGEYVKFEDHKAIVDSQALEIERLKDRIRGLDYWSR